jgi:hypothetical protein
MATEKLSIEFITSAFKNRAVVSIWHQVFRTEYAPSNNRAYGKNNLTNDTCASAMGCAVSQDWPLTMTRAFLSVRTCPALACACLYLLVLRAAIREPRSILCLYLCHFRHVRFRFYLRVIDTWIVYPAC